MKGMTRSALTRTLTGTAKTIGHISVKALELSHGKAGKVREALRDVAELSCAVTVGLTAAAETLESPLRIVWDLALQHRLDDVRRDLDALSRRVREHRPPTRVATRDSVGRRLEGRPYDPAGWGKAWS